MYELTTDFMNLSLIEAGLSGFGGNSQIHVQNELSHILIQSLYNVLSPGLFR